MNPEQLIHDAYRMDVRLKKQAPDIAPSDPVLCYLADRLHNLLLKDWIRSYGHLPIDAQTKTELIALLKQQTWDRQFLEECYDWIDFTEKQKKFLKKKIETR